MASASYSLETYLSTKARFEALHEKRNKALAALPRQFGLSNNEEFLAAFHAATGAAPVRRGNSSGRSPAASARAESGGTRKRRAKITPEMKQKLKQLVASGKTGAEVAKELGISLPSVANIKKELRLSRPQRTKSR